MKFKNEIENLEIYKPGKPIEEVKRELGLKKVYKLASNENPFPPFYLKKFIKNEIRNLHRYPLGGCFYLRNALAEKLGVNKDQLIFGNGSDEIIAFVLRGFVEEGDEVIISHPTFLIYEIQAKLQKGTVIKVPMKDYRYSLEEMAQRVTDKTKVIFVANPDNPTGTYVTDKEVRSFLEKIPKRVLVFFDEAYFEFAPLDFPKTLDILKERENVIFTRTFSKAYGLAGLRIGYGVSSGKIIAYLNKVREPFNVNRFAQAAALAALRNEKYLKKAVSFVKKEKEYFYIALEQLGLSFAKSAANFVLVNFGSDTTGLAEYLLKKGIIIRELKAWGLNNFFRVTVGTRKENRKFIAELRKYLIEKQEVKK